MLTERVRTLLERAKHAAERSEKAKDPEIKGIWSQIAEGYKTLARNEERIRR